MTSMSSETRFSVGDRVRVRKDAKELSEQTDWPEWSIFMDEYLGQEFSVTKVSEIGSGCYLNSSRYCFLFSWLEPANSTTPQACTCDTFMLFARGCQCGAITREREATKS